MMSLLISPAFAQTATGTAEAGGASIVMQILPLVVIFAIFYFIVIRPQSKRMRQHAQTIEALKRGDKILTAGGVIAVVRAVTEKTVTAEIASGVEIVLVKNTIMGRYDPETGAAQADVEILEPEAKADKKARSKK